MMMPQEQLLTRARELDVCALEDIYDLYSPRLYRYAIRLLGDACAAEDCVAETFSRFLRALQSGRGPRDYLQAYLFRMLHNLIVDHFHCQQPQASLTESLADCSDTEDSASRSIRQKRVRAAVQRLTVDQQKVIALKYLEGWENDEIARTLKKPVGAVKSLQHRALAQLQKILLQSEELDDET